MAGRAQPRPRATITPELDDPESLVRSVMCSAAPHFWQSVSRVRFGDRRGGAETARCGVLGGVYVRGSYVLGPEAASDDDRWDELQRAEADEFRDVDR